MKLPARILFPIYDGVTQLDFTGPHQFFVRSAGTEVVVASLGGEPVAAEGLVFSDLTDLESVESCDVLCVPGGVGCVSAMENDRFLENVRRLGGSATYLTSVCTGSLILAAAGLISGRKAACHWAWRELLPNFGVIPDAGRVVRDGNLITAGGVTSGIDFALTVIAEIAGETEAQLTQLALEYAPEPPFGAGRPESAPPEILAELLERISAEREARRERVVAVAEKIRVAAG